MTQMDRVTQANSAQTQDLSGTAQSLAEQSGRLLELISAFHLGSDGNGNIDVQPAPHKAAPAQPKKPSARRSIFVAATT